nr:hypothetical protein [Tanacetum cinerariifolium]
MDSEPWRHYGEDSAETGPPRVIVYRYDGLLIQPVVPPFLDYVSGSEHLPSPDYDQPLPADTSPIAASLDYVADSDLEEDPEDDQADYPADGGDGDDEPSDDDDNDDTDDEEPEEEPFKEDEEEEEEHLALADSSTIHIIDPVLLAGDTDALEADEPTHAPGLPIIIPLSQTRLCRSRKTVRPEPPIPTDTRAPLGYRAAEIRMRALLPSTSHGTDIPEADFPSRKRACLTTLALRCEIGESFAAGAARQPAPIESDLKRRRVEQAGYGITDTWDEIVDTLMKIAPTTLERVNERVTELDTIVRSRNGDNSNDSGTGGRRQMTTPRECSYTDFLKCQPMSFQGT